MSEMSKSKRGLFGQRKSKFEKEKKAVQGSREDFDEDDEIEEGLDLDFAPGLM